MTTHTPTPVAPAFVAPVPAGEQVDTPETGSAYPAPIDTLLPRARTLVVDGTVPSRNKLMAELKIGAPKAAALRDALTAEINATSPRGHLHLVDTDHADDPAPLSDPVTENADPVTPVGTDEPVDVEPCHWSQKKLEHRGQEKFVKTEPGSWLPPLPAPAPEAFPLADVDGHPGTTPEPVHLFVRDEMADYVRPAAQPEPVRGRVPRSWPVLLLAIGAFATVWSGWVGLGGMTGFGIVHPLPGIWDSFHVNTAITLPLGVEAYAAFALRVWLSPHVSRRTRRFARASAVGALVLGALGQIAYHLMTALGIVHAPWPITAAVSCLPVIVLGLGAALAHMLQTDRDQQH